MEKKYVIVWELEFEQYHTSRKAAIEKVRRELNKLYATSSLSSIRMVRCD